MHMTTVVGNVDAPVSADDALASADVAHSLCVCVSVRACVRVCSMR